MRATDGILRSWIIRAGRRGWPVSPLVVASIAFVAALSLFLFMRRTSGAFTSSLAGPQLVATAIVMCAWALIVREITAKRAIFFWISLGTVLLVAIACSFPAARILDWLVWVPAIGLVSIWPIISKTIDSPSQHEKPNVLEIDSAPEQVLQQLTRIRTGEGKEAIRGILTAEFATGERQTTLYVSFCPPFETLPEIEANSTSDFEADIKLVQVLHNGAQFEVRLSEPAEEPLAISIEFFASERV